MRSIIAAIILSFLVTATYAADESGSHIGTYCSTGTHPWTLTIEKDGCFQIYYSDSGGFNQHEGLWKKKENKIYLLVQNEGKYEVFRILTLSESGPAMMKSPIPTVIELSDVRSAQAPRIDQIEIVEPEFEFYKK